MGQKDKFALKAKDYDALQRRVANANRVANKIRSNIKLHKGMHLIDFGAGTGLLLEAIANDIGKVTAIDISPSMIAVLREKTLPCDIEIKELNLAKEDLEIEADGIISSMTLHHIKDVSSLFQKFYKMLKRGGFIAVSDLDKEDGTFHTLDTGVEHFGFDREEFINYAKYAGFKNVKVEYAATIHKPHRDFTTFLLTAYK